MRFLLKSGIQLVILTSLYGCPAVSASQPAAVPAAPARVGVTGDPGQCTTVLDCSNLAVRAAQNAEIEARLAASSLPVGTVVAFSGSQGDATAQQQNGWWIADGRIVLDNQSAWNGKATPNLVDLFIKGSATAGATGGAPAYTIPAQSIQLSQYNLARQDVSTATPLIA